MTAFFSRFRRLISAISGACRRNSIGVTRVRTFSQTGAVRASTSGVNSSAAVPTAMALSPTACPWATLTALSRAPQVDKCDARIAFATSAGDDFGRHSNPAYELLDSRKELFRRGRSEERRVGK